MNITVKCRFCGERIALNEDTHERRLSQTDPHQQLRRHLLKLKAPFPWFGGKSRVAPIVWERFGDVTNYVEPFAGSLAVLLGRPTTPKTETVNDLDCYLANFWRATSIDPEGVAEFTDWPVNEADLHARHLWLVKRDEFRERMKTDPEFYDPRVAGWWVWGLCQWIGSGWCNSGQGINRMIHAGHVKRPMLSGNGHGVGVHADRGNYLLDYFEALRDRLRRVRVCCGDWRRVTGPSVTEKHGASGIFLDPPYDMRVVLSKDAGRDGAAQSDAIYAHHDNKLAADVRAWAIENGDNPLLRIALCGYEDEHAAHMPDTWDCFYWEAHERIWFSPYCLKPQKTFQFEEVLAL